MKRKRYSNIRDVSKDPDHHADIIGDVTRWKDQVFEVKSYHETSSDPRVQIEKEYLEDNKNYIFVGYLENGRIEAYRAKGSKIAKLIEDEKSPAKIELEQIRSLKELTDFTLDREVEEWFSFHWINEDEEKGFIQVANFEEVFNAPGTIANARSKKKQQEIYNSYIESDMIPLFRGHSFEGYAPIPMLEDALAQQEKVSVIAEKKSFIEKKYSVENAATTQGNRTQTRARGFVFSGLFQQKSSESDKDNIIPLIFDTDKIRVDNDNIGHLIGFFNNMYSLRDPFAKTLYFKKDDFEKAHRPDLIKVNNALGKSIMDSLGYEQGKVLAKIKVNDDTTLGDLATYTDVKGEPQNLSLSEQQLSIVDFVVKPNASIVLHTQLETPITFKFPQKEGKPVDIPDFDRGILRFNELGKQEIEFLTSDILLEAVVRRYNFEPGTVQALSESLNRQGWISYPRVDQNKADQEETGIELLKPLEEFTGSQNERKILQVIDRINSSEENFVKFGEWELLLDDFKIVTRKNDYVHFTDKPEVFIDDGDKDEFDLEVVKRGVTPVQMTNYLTRKGREIGTPGTRTAFLDELTQSGIISLKVRGKRRVYQTDQRGYYFKAAYQFLTSESTGNHSVIQLGRQINNTGTIDEIIDLMNSFEPINVFEFQQFVRKEVERLIEFEEDIQAIDEL